MGTRGLKIIRFGGRYFVYWNQYDSYPEVLGQMLVGSIPIDPAQYKKWLENERAIYAQMIADLESNVLNVTEEKIAADLKRGASAVTGNAPDNVTYSAKSETLKPYEVLDDRLHEFPSFFCGEGIDIFVEWVYVIDLDRELFTVCSNRQQVDFRMNDIPRDRWVQAVENGGDGSASEDEKDNEVQGTKDNVSLGIGPEGRKRYPNYDYFADKESRAEYEARYRSYKCFTRQAKVAIDSSSKIAQVQILSVVTFEKLVAPSHLHLKNYFQSWSHRDTAFRELAFAIFSLAAGQYRFAEEQSLEGQKTNGYLLDNSRGKLELLPLFGSGCHDPTEDAGSSPQETIYWFQNVLVSLVPDAVLEEYAEAAIAELVEFGLDSSKDFYAVVFSLINVVMLHVTVEGGVTTVNQTPITQVVSLEIDANRERGQLELSSQRRAGFISLMHFFNAAANRSVAPFNQGCFSTEIYSKILADLDDYATYKACSSVSEVFRAINLDKIAFGNRLTSVEFISGPSEKKDWAFRFPDDVVQNVKEDGPSEAIEPIGGEYWSPVIGMKRPSIITGVKIWFDTPKPPIPRRGRVRLDGFNGPYNNNAFAVKVLWNLPEDVTARQVEEIWAYYLLGFLNSQMDAERYIYTTPYTFRCTLIPHYREFSITNMKRRLWLCFRRPIDGRTPQQRADTLTYLTSRFRGRTKNTNFGPDPAEDGELVILAFGFDVTLYHWRKGGDEDEGSLVRYLRFDDFSRVEARSEMEAIALRPLAKEWKEDWAQGVD